MNKNYPRFEDVEKCKACGHCCAHSGGGLTPEEARELMGGGITVDTILAATQDNLTVSISQDSSTDEYSPIARLRYKHYDPANDRLEEPVAEVFSNLGKCINLGENGCTMPLEDRPQSCSTLNPDYCDIPNYPSKKSSWAIRRADSRRNIFDATLDYQWREHQKTLGRAVAQITGKSIRELYDERRSATLSGVDDILECLESIFSQLL